MASQFLPVYRENARYYIEEFLDGLKSLKPSWDSAQEISKLYRTLAISSLFLDDDERAFFTNLSNSAYAFLYVGEKLKPQGFVVSKNGAFFDAVACRNDEAARRIARLCPVKHSPDFEYEDDFIFVSFLMKKYCLDAAPKELATMMARYEELLNGDHDPHFELCKALEGSDVELFNKSLGELIEKREAYYRKLTDDESISPEDAAIEAKLYVDGLALLNLAEKSGMDIREEYSYIPNKLRVQVAITFNAEDWKSSK